MHCIGQAALSDILADRVLYRNLQPVDSRLPGLARLAGELGLAGAPQPRKGEPEYARVVATILRAAQEMAQPGRPIRRLLYAGDTEMSDGGTFTTLCAAGGWPGRAFICSEEPGAPRDLTQREDGIYLARQWAAVADFARGLERSGFAVDAQTAVILDMDKTLLGARGRNHAPIDAARMAALRATVTALLPDEAARQAFEHAYAALNRPAYHGFTGDNQDYLAYLCLMIGGGVIALDDFLAAWRSRALAAFPDLLAWVDDRLPALPALADLHRDVAARVRAGDPTPFKAFRRREFRETAARMGCVPDGAPVERMLRDEIVITAEVWAVARQWAAQGALLLGLSDKPDEAALPAPEAATEGALPLHRARTHVVGN